MTATGEYLTAMKMADWRTASRASSSTHLSWLDDDALAAEMRPFRERIRREPQKPSRIFEPLPHPPRNYDEE